MELLLAIGILGVMSSVTIIAINPAKQLQSAADAKRKTMATQQENALMQYVIANSTIPTDTIPTGEPQAMPICRGGITDPSCIDLSGLVPTFLSSLPVDPAETNIKWTGSYVYLDNSYRLRICQYYLPTGESRRCSTSTYVPGAPTSYVCPGNPIFAGGNGFVATPYQICSCEGLQAMSSANHYIIIHDVDCTASASWNGGAGYNPMTFFGTLNGQNYTVDGLRINRPTTDFIGLFGLVSGATIQNLRLTNINFNGGSRVGGLAGSLASSTVTNVSVSGTINASGALGMVGGLVGVTQTSPTISRSSTNVAITAVVSGAGGGAGGLIGLAQGPIVSNSYARGNVSVTGGPAGGLFGYGQSGGSVSTSYSTGTVTTNHATVSGFATLNGMPSTNNFYDRTTSGKSDTAAAAPKLTSEMQTQSTFTGWDFINIWQMSSNNYPTLR